MSSIPHPSLSAAPAPSRRSGLESTARRWSARCWRTSLNEPRVCAMVGVPAPEEEDRRRLCRELKSLIGERIRHANRLKGLFFALGITGYEPRRHDRRERLEELCTGDRRSVPAPEGRWRCARSSSGAAARQIDTAKQNPGMPSARGGALAADTTPGRVEMLLRLKASALGSRAPFGRKISGTSTTGELAAYASGTHALASRSVDHEQGVSKAGNPRLRRPCWSSWRGCG